MSLEAYSKKRFLIVDELDSFRFSTKKILKSLGLKLVDTSESAQKVVNGFQNVNYDVVLCNYDLGKGKNGQELLEELRFRKLLKFTGLFFIVSAEVAKDKVMGTIENEPDGYLVKPVTPKDLIDRLGKSLARKEAMREIDQAIDEEDYASAIQYCDRKIANKDRYLTLCLKTKAWLLTKTGDLDAAQSVYESILKANDFIWAEYGLARIQIKRKDYDAAEKLLLHIIQKDDNQVEAKDMLAEVYLHKDESDKAHAMLKDALAHSPNSLLRQKALAELCMKNGQKGEAIEAFRKVIKLGDQSVYSDPEQYYQFSDYLVAQFGEKDDDPHVKEAFELLEKSKKRFTLIPQIEQKARLMEANLHASMGHENEAERILEDVSKKAEKRKDPLQPGTIQLMARTLYSLGKNEEAEAALENAADLCADDAEVRASIYDQLKQNISLERRQKATAMNKAGIKFYNGGLVSDAAEKLREAIPFTPRHISLNLNLIQVLLKQARVEYDETLISECEEAFHRIRHIPEQHKEYKRFQYLTRQLEQTRK